MKPLKIVIPLLLIFLFQSCTKDVDFDQIDDASVQTEYLITLVHLNLGAPKFLDEFNEEIIFTTDVIQAPIQDDSEPYLEKIEFTVVTANTFDRNFAFNVVFFNALGEQIYVLEPTVNILPNSTEITTIIEIPQEDIGIIYDTRYFGFSVEMSTSSDGSVISMDDPSILVLKSSVKLFFNFR